MSDNSGNLGLAADITVETAVAFSDAIIVAFQICDDLGIPLSPEQKKHVLSASISAIIDMRERIGSIIELDDIARDILSTPEGVKNSFKEITIEYED